jgi:hypothetical protein
MEINVRGVYRDIEVTDVVIEIVDDPLCPYEWKIERWEAEQLMNDLRELLGADR